MSAEASSAYNEPFIVRLTGTCDLDHVQQAIQTVLIRHKALHMRFSQNGDYQYPVEPTPPNMMVQDLSGLDSQAQDAQVQAVFAGVGATPFDLVNGPLSNVQILKLSAEDHILVFTCHHIVCDGWSWNLMLREIGNVYTGLSNGAPYQLKSAASYSNYIIQDAERQASEDLAQSYQYWLDQFADLPEPLDLPTDQPRPSIKTYKGSTVTYFFRQEVYEAAKKTAASQKASLFSILFASFNLLLARLSNQDDIVMTVPAAGQLMSGQTNLVGHCVNLLPIRTRLDFSQPFNQFLANTTTQVLDAYDHQDCTLGGIVKRLKMPRNPARMPLAEINFNVDRDDAGVSFGQLDVTVAQTPKQAVIFDIFFNINETNKGLMVDCDFNADLYSHDTIQRWITYYEMLLENIAADPTQILANLSVLSEVDNNTLVSVWNQTAIDYPHDLTVADLVAKQATQTPEATAILFEGQALNYGELDQRANQVANYLHSQGIAQNAYVGLYMERSADMLVGLLGILKAGATYVPMDPTYPNQRLAYMVEDSQMQLIVTEKILAEQLNVGSAQAICLDSDWAQIAQQTKTPPSVVVAADDLAYVIYTSGSTGKPKGVQVPHRAFTNFLCSMQREPGISANDILLSVTTISFDIAALELFLPLIAGATVVILDQAAAADGQKIDQALDECKATMMQATPATWRLLLDSGWAGRETLKMLCGGEALSANLAQKLAQKGYELWNMYGPTETTIWSSICKISGTESKISIGRPIANTQFYILNDDLQPAPIGVAGTLYISGDGLAKGYLNQSQLTAERFIPHPFSPDGAARIYNTGDLARYMPDGRVACLGRLDHQVKIRGFRIELDEIQAILQQHANIRENVVIVREDTADDQRIVAYLVSDGEPTAVGELRRYLQKQLPDYMVPAHFVFLDALPLTPNGKVDRLALPIPDMDRPDIDSLFVAPETEAEKTIAAIWQTVLKVDQVGIHDNFFDLGGHSLLAIQVINKVRSELNVPLPVGSLFEVPTIGELMQRIEAIQYTQIDDVPKADNDDSEREEIVF